MRAGIVCPNPKSQLPKLGDLEAQCPLTPTEAPPTHRPRPAAPRLRPAYEVPTAPLRLRPHRPRPTAGAAIETQKATWLPPAWEEGF